MYVKQIYTDCLSQASYYIESKNESVIIDPIRDIDYYDNLLNKRSAKLKYVLETHFHADFISGHIELSNKYSCPIVFGPNAKTDFKSLYLNDGDTINIGDVCIKVIHTPGHTLESVCYLLFDKYGKQHSLYTGDTLFIGDIGRPDLAINNNISIYDLASMLYESLYEKILKLDEKIIIYPAHGPGTQCGKTLSEEIFSTLKEQKETNYALKFNNKEDFIKSITNNIPKAPEYFKDSALLNKKGYKKQKDLFKKSYKSLKPNEIIDFIEQNINIIDTRETINFSRNHIINSINIPLCGRFAITAANLLKLEDSLVIICDKGKEDESIVRLSRVGFENVIGYYNKNIKIPDFDGYLRKLPSKKGSEIHEMYNYDIIDVRMSSEHDNNSLKNSINVPLYELNDSIHVFDKNKKYVLHCRSGYRSSVASSILLKNNIKNILNISDGMIGIEKNKKVIFN
tara:strand:- start:2866 stop:4230 length:1365 start_codon:yes stop_codon:yes gene_type:complete